MTPIESHAESVHCPITELILTQVHMFKRFVFYQTTAESHPEIITETTFTSREKLECFSPFKRLFDRSKKVRSTHRVPINSQLHQTSVKRDALLEQTGKSLSRNTCLVQVKFAQRPTIVISEPLCDEMDAAVAQIIPFDVQSGQGAQIDDDFGKLRSYFVRQIIASD